MSASDPSVSLKSNTPLPGKASALVFEKKSASFLQVIPTPIDSTADSGNREPPPSTVLNCNLHNGFV